MPEITLVAETGRPVGSRPSGRLRAAGKIPGVMYGHGNDPVPVAVDGRALRAALTTDAGLNALLSLDLGGRTQLAMAKEVQRDPVRGRVVHVDFLIVSRDEVVTADVPITLVGEAVELHKNEGVVGQELFTLTVHATPADIPPHLEVDITNLMVGDTIRVGDLALPSGVTTDVDAESAVVLGQPPQVRAADLVPEGAEEAEEAAEEEEEGAEAAAAEGGEAPAAEAAEGAGDAAAPPSAESEH